MHVALGRRVPYTHSAIVSAKFEVVRETDAKPFLRIDHIFYGRATEGTRVK
jgi:hypothetical protein